MSQRMRIRPGLCLCLLLTGVCFLVGCGGDDGPTDAEKRAEQIAQAERQRAIDLLQREVDSLKEQLDDTRNRIADYRADLRRADQKEPRPTLIATIADADTRIATLTGQLEEATQTLETMKAMSDQAILQQPEVRQALDRDVSLRTLQAMLDSQTERLRQAPNRGATDEQIASLREQIAATRAEYKRQRDLVVSKIWGRRLGTKAAEIATLENRINTLTAEKQRAAAELALLRKPVAELIETAEATERALVDRIASLQARIKNIREGGPLSPADRLGVTDVGPEPAATEEPAP